MIPIAVIPIINNYYHLTPYMWNYLLLIAEDVPTAGLHPLVHGGGGVNDEAVEDLEGLLCRGEQGRRSVFSENSPFS